MEVANVLRSGFALANQRAGMFALDLLWKFFHVVSTVVLISSVAGWLLQDLQKFQWQGPQLTPSNPILLAMVFANLWMKYSGTLAWAAIGVLTGAVGLWIVFEAYFRGGVERFWIYVATRMAFLVIMLSAVVLLLTLTFHEGRAESGGAMQSGIVSIIVLLGMWWIVSSAETLLRRDAIELLATNLVAVSGALGSLLGIQFLLSVAAIATVSLSGRMMLHSSMPSQFFAASLLLVAALIVWSIVHSYLVVVRYSTIDIMRDNVVDL